MMTQVIVSQKINFQDIVKLELLSDDKEIVLISLKSRTVRLVISDSAGFLSTIQRNMKVWNFMPGSELWSCLLVSCHSGVCTFVELLFPGTDVEVMAVFSCTRVGHVE